MLVPHVRFGSIRFPQWDAAIGTGEHAADVIAGVEGEYERLPYWSSNIGALRVAEVGVAAPVAEWSLTDGLHVGRDAAGRRVCAWWSTTHAGFATRDSSCWMHDPAVPVSEPTAPEIGPLRLDAPREEVLGRAAEIVAAAWRSFDRFRPGQPPVDDVVRGARRTRAARGADAGLSRPRRRGHVLDREPRATAAAVLRVRRLVGAGDRVSSGDLLGGLLRRQSRGLGRGGDRGRGAGRALGR